MAVFLINICKFNGCGITFPSLGDLIKHIEYTHIDNDPKTVELRERAPPACVPLSYVLRFLSDDAPKEIPIGINASNLSNHNASSNISTTNAVTGTAASAINNNNSNGIINNNNNNIISNNNNNNNNSINTTVNDLKRKMAIKHHSYSMSSSNRSNTPTGSEMDEDEMMVTESEDSNESWTTEEFSSEFIMRHSMNGASNGTPGNEKPFACPVPGCKKRYKNVNGIKYHSKNGHKKDGKVRKGYKCHCGKSYKTAQGLKNHALGTHNSMPDSGGVGNSASTNGSNNTNNMGVHHVTGSSTSVTNGVGGGALMQQRSTSPSQQSLGSLSPSSISNMSSSASSCHGSSSINGTNNSHATTANLVLQQLTNGGAGNGSGSSNHVINTSSNAAVNHHNQQQQQPPQQQQFTITATASSNPMHNGLGNSSALQHATSDNTTLQLHNGRPAVAATAADAAALPITMPTTTTIIAASLGHDSKGAAMTPMMSMSNSNNNNKNSSVGTNNNKSTAATTTTTIYQQRPVASVGVINKLTTTTTTTTPRTSSTENVNRPISPRFIEHKCSVNLFKEKFLANLRNNQDVNKMQVKSCTTSSISKLNYNIADGLGSKESDTKEELVQVGGGGPNEPVASHEVTSKGIKNIENAIPDTFVMQKHLNANFPNAIYTKTIN